MANEIISERLKALLGVSELAAKHGPPSVSNKSLGDVLSALSEFMECVRYLNTRRSTGTILTLDSEDAIQDAIYLMLRPWIPDMVPENPTDKVANRFLVKDFLIPSLSTVIEVKYIRDKTHGKNVAKEINDDIETYRYHQACHNIIFFIYDPDVFIPDRQKLEQHISSKRVYSEKVLVCYPIIRP
jgi:hypothetical protein